MLTDLHLLLKQGLHCTGDSLFVLVLNLKFLCLLIRSFITPTRSHITFPPLLAQQVMEGPHDSEYQTLWNVILRGGFWQQVVAHWTMHYLVYGTRFLKSFVTSRVLVLLSHPSKHFYFESLIRKPKWAVLGRWLAGCHDKVLPLNLLYFLSLFFQILSFIYRYIYRPIYFNSLYVYNA